MYGGHASLPHLQDLLDGLRSSVLVKGGNTLHALTEAPEAELGARRPLLASVELCNDGSDDVPLVGGVAHRLLAPNQYVLDANTFVDVAATLPPEQLRASLENCLLECTNTRVTQRHEHPSLAGRGECIHGVAALVQHLREASASQLQLFPAEAGLPTVAQLLTAAVLPPTATSRFISPPAAHVFAAHSRILGGRSSAAELFDTGVSPCVHERTHSHDRIHNHVRSAALSGSTLFTLFPSGSTPMWQRFEFDMGDGAGGAVPSADPSSSKAAGGSEAAAGKKQHQTKRKQEGDTTGHAAPATDTVQQQQQQGGLGRSGSSGGGLGPYTLLSSACSCSQPDLGVLWCSHRANAMAALLCDPGLHVLKSDALSALLHPLSSRQLAQLLLTVAFACGTLADLILSLQLPPERQSSCFLRHLGSLPLSVPLNSDLRKCNSSFVDASWRGTSNSSAQIYQIYREINAAANPNASGHLVTRLSVLSGAKGSAVQAVARHVVPLSPELIWHLTGMGVDVDMFPETRLMPRAGGVWPAEVRGTVNLSFEDALGLTRALSMLGGGYAGVALRLLKDLTRTSGHPHYWSACVQTNAVNDASFIRRLTQLWQQLTTPDERWQLFMERGLKLPTLWSGCVREVAWHAVGEFPTMWTVARNIALSVHGTKRAAAMALVTRPALLPHAPAPAGTSAYTDMLLFESHMRRGAALHAQELCEFLRKHSAELHGAREGSLMQLAASSLARQLMPGKQPLAQCHAAFEALITDLQQTVLLEAARLLERLAAVELPTRAQPMPATLEACLPAELRSVNQTIKANTVGLLNSGRAHNSEGMLRHALPQHLPPPLASSPFTWVTLDLKHLLGLPSYGCWACTYLQLAPKYTPAGAVALWAWLRESNILGTLLNGAASAVARSDWHSAAMLADSAGKYLTKGVEIAPVEIRQERQQLLSLRPLLRSLAFSAGAHLYQFLVEHAAGTILTHSSSLRACCLLLRGVLALMAEAVDPVLLKAPALQPHAETALEQLEEDQRQIAHALADAGELQVLLGDATDPMHQQLQQNLQLLASRVQRLEQQNAAAAALHAPAAALATQPAAAQAPAANPQQPGGPAQPVQGPLPATLAAAVVEGRAVAQLLSQEDAAALAEDASTLLQVCAIVLRLLCTTLEARPLLPLQSGEYPHGTAARLAPLQQDTALWRAAETTPVTHTHPHYQAAHDPDGFSRTFALEDIASLLAQLLPLTLLPLQAQLAQQGPVAGGQPTAAAAAAGQAAAAGTAGASAGAGAGSIKSEKQQQEPQQQQQKKQKKQQHGDLAAAAARPSFRPRLTRAKAQAQGLAGGAADVGAADVGAAGEAAGEGVPGETSVAAERQQQQQQQQHSHQNSQQQQTPAPQQPQRPPPQQAQHAQQQGATIASLLENLLPYVDRLTEKLLEVSERAGGGVDGRSSGSAAVNRLKRGEPLSLVCSLMYVTALTSEGGACQLARMTNAWKLLATNLADLHPNVVVRARLGQCPSYLLSNVVLPPTLLHMLRVCSVSMSDPASEAEPGPAAHTVPHDAGSQQPSSDGGAAEGKALAAHVHDGEGGEPPAKRRRSGRSRQQPAPSKQAAESGASKPAAAAAASGGTSTSQEVPAHAAVGAGATPAATSASSVPHAGLGKMHVGGTQLSVALVQAAVHRALLGLVTATQEHWQGSNYVNHPRANPVTQLQQEAGSALAVGQVVQAALGQAMQAAAHTAALAAAIAAAQAAGGQPFAAQGVEQANPAAVPPQLLQPLPLLPRPRRAFVPRQLATSLAGAFNRCWAVSSVEVLHWWLQYHRQLQPAQVAVGEAAVAAATDAQAADGGVVYDGELSFNQALELDLAAEMADNRATHFMTLDGPVCMPPSRRQAPKLRYLGGTLLTLLCMECPPEVHTAASAALLALAAQPGGAADLLDSPAFLVLRRVLMREDLPPALRQHGQAVVGGVESALVAHSSEWEAVMNWQQAAMADADRLAAERGARGAAGSSQALPPHIPYLPPAHGHPAMVLPQLHGPGAFPIVHGEDVEWDDEGDFDDEGEEWDDDDFSDDDGDGDWLF